ncbi:MAG: hypothetical protein AB7O57_14995 [Hyphomicrobiaceae bacterium]
MRKRVVGERAQVRDDGNMDASADVPSRATADRRNQLAYVADLAEELGALAKGLGSPTLTGLLELAHIEARLEMERGQPG